MTSSPESSVSIGITPLPTLPIEGVDTETEADEFADFLSSRLCVFDGCVAVDDSVMVDGRGSQSCGAWQGASILGLKRSPSSGTDEFDAAGSGSVADVLSGKSMPLALLLVWLTDEDIRVGAVVRREPRCCER